MIQMTANGVPFLYGRWPLDTSLRTIIFIHGAGSSKNFWKNQVAGLSEYCNTIAIDLPGHGDNTNDGLDSIEGYSLIVENFIKELNPPYPVPCGLSMGGAITLNLLLNDSFKYNTGIIINSGARLKVMPTIFEMIKNNYSGYISSIPAIGASSSADISMLADIISDAEKCRPEVVFNDFSACNSFDVTEKLSNINIPLLVLTAEEDKLSPKKYGIFIADRVKDSSHVNIYGAGHFSPAEQPDRVNEAILNFLKGRSLL